MNAVRNLALATLSMFVARPKKEPFPTEVDFPCELNGPVAVPMLGGTYNLMTGEFKESTTAELAEMKARAIVLSKCREIVIEEWPDHLDDEEKRDAAIEALRREILQVVKFDDKFEDARAIHAFKERPEA